MYAFKIGTIRNMHRHYRYLLNDTNETFPYFQSILAQGMRTSTQRSTGTRATTDLGSQRGIDQHTGSG